MSLGPKGKHLFILYASWAEPCLYISWDVLCGFKATDNPRFPMCDVVLHQHKIFSSESSHDFVFFNLFTSRNLHKLDLVVVAFGFTVHKFRLMETTIPLPKTHSLQKRQLGLGKLYTLIVFTTQCKRTFTSESVVTETFRTDRNTYYTIVGSI